MTPEITRDPGYVFRWYCDACNEAGDWHTDLTVARATETEHTDEHDEPLYEPTRIQRSPVADARGYTPEADAKNREGTDA